MPASGHLRQSKMNPSATMEDQEVEMARVVLGPPAFSSNRPHTDAVKSLVEVDQDGNYAPTHEDAAKAAAGDRRDEADAKMKAGDWKDEVEAASTQDDLDAVAQRYADSGADFKTVEDAIEKRQADLDSANS
jgi:hypothetical protein